MIDFYTFKDRCFVLPIIKIQSKLKLLIHDILDVDYSYII